MSARTAVRSVERPITVFRTGRLRTKSGDPEWATYLALTSAKLAADRDESWQLGAAWNAAERAKMLEGAA